MSKDSYVTAFEAVLSNEVIDLTNQVAIPYGAESFVRDYISDPAAVLANLYCVAVSARAGLDDHVIASVLRASLHGKIASTADFIVRNQRTRAIASYQEDLECSAVTMRKMELI